MAYQITLKPSGHQYQVDADDFLLEAALEAGLILPYGCRNGACGSCRARIIEGEVDHGNRAQSGALPENARAEGYALLCCAKAESDLLIECRELGDNSKFPLRIMPCRVEELTRLDDDVMLMRLKLPVNERLAFRAGQYVEILQKGEPRRAFSLANAPHDDGFLQIHIRHIEGGRFTSHVFDAMKVKDILRFEGPHGSFYLREESAKPIVFLAGSTGFAPIKSMIEHAIHNHIKRPMYLYWGARRKSGLYMHRLAEQWAADHSHIHYTPVVSEHDEHWPGRRGLVHAAVMVDHADLSGFQVYACGSPAMIDAARSDFRERGLPPDEFFADAFTFAT